MAMGGQQRAKVMRVEQTRVTANRIQTQTCDFNKELLLQCKHEAVTVRQRKGRGANCGSAVRPGTQEAEGWTDQSHPCCRHNTSKILKRQTY